MSPNKLKDPDGSDRYRGEIMLNYDNTVNGLKKAERAAQEAGVKRCSLWVSQAPGLINFMHQENPVKWDPNTDVLCSGPAGLANEIHKMLTSNKVVHYPSPFDDMLEEQSEGLGFIQSKTTLLILKSCVGADPQQFAEKVMSQVKHRQTIKNVHFYPVPGYQETDAPFDFSECWAKHMAPVLPNVEFLGVRHMSLTNLVLESKRIKTLRLIDPQLQDGVWELNLPNLEHLHMENHSPPSENFGRALINSPGIQSYYSHKYWPDPQTPLPGLIINAIFCISYNYRIGR